jgi:hypothetical protein
MVGETKRNLSRDRHIMKKKEEILTTILGNCPADLAAWLLEVFPDATDGAILVYRSAGGAWIAEKLSLTDLAEWSGAVGANKVVYFDPSGDLTAGSIGGFLNAMFGSPSIGSMIYKSDTNVWTKLSPPTNSALLTYKKSSNAPLWLIGATGYITYHNGTNWVSLPPSDDGKILTLSSSLPSWQDSPLPSSPTEGDLLLYTSGAWTRLPIGESGQILGISDGKPTWMTPVVSWKHLENYEMGYTTGNELKYTVEGNVA